MKEKITALFLMTLLKNSEKVVRFKIKLTKEFYRMRTALLERQTTEWQQTKIKGKLVRRKEQMHLYSLKHMQKNKERVNHILMYIPIIPNLLIML